LKKETIEVLDTISDDDLFKNNDFVLVGGTALSIHLNHRLSEDLDFMLINKGVLPLDDIILFKEKYNAEFIPFSVFEEDCAINDGEDIYNYHQRYSIDSIKIDFFVNSGNILEKQIVTNKNKIHYKNNIYLASIESIFILKSLLLMERCKIRDLFDLYILINKYNFTIKDLIRFIKKYKITYTEEDILRWLEDKKNKIDEDEGFYALVNETPSYEQLVDFFIKQIENNIKQNIIKRIKNECIIK